MYDKKVFVNKISLLVELIKEFQLVIAVVAIKGFST